MLLIPSALLGAARVVSFLAGANSVLCRPSSSSSLSLVVVVVVVVGVVAVAVVASSELGSLSFV